MRNILILACLILCTSVYAYRSKDIRQLAYEFVKRESERYCDKYSPNCTDCLASSRYCTWCSNAFGPKCTSILQCPKESSTSDCESLTTVLDTQKENIAELLLRELDSATSKAGCDRRGNCSSCTSSPSCLWCEKTRKCFPFAGDSNATTLCGSTLWYRDQCLYKSTITPCSERTGCNECTKDNLCFWCKSTGNCSYYPHDAYQPKDCHPDSLFYKQCSHMNFWVVLSPILAIILAPILIFIILGIVFWCMGKFCDKDDEGEEADEEDESNDESPPPGPPQKKMLMSHRPEPSRVEELRKKYNLGR